MQVNLLLNCFRRYSCDKTPPKKEALIKMISYLNKEYYEFVITHYPNYYTAVILKFFEEEEEYEICKKIVERVTVYNLVNSDTISTKLTNCNEV
jgi:hypothetical protein